MTQETSESGITLSTPQCDKHSAQWLFSSSTWRPLQSVKDTAPRWRGFVHCIKKGRLRESLENLENVIQKNIGNTERAFGRLPKTLETLREHLEDFQKHWKHLENIWQTSKNIGNTWRTFGRLPKTLETLKEHLADCQKHWKHLENIWKTSKIIGNTQEHLEDFQ